MEIKHNNVKYVLDPEAAISAGAMKRKTHSIELNEDEVAILRYMTQYVGGPPTGARGFVDSIANKLGKLPVIECSKPINIDHVKSEQSPVGFYFL